MRPAALRAVGGASAGGAAGGAAGHGSAVLGCGGSAATDQRRPAPTHSLPPYHRYTADLKRPRSQSPAAKKAAVDELIEVLALDGCRNVRIGK